MNTPRTNKFVDGKDQSLWPLDEHIGWTVQTAGWVHLDDILPKSGSYNQGPKRNLPPKTRLLLKSIEGGKAFAYDYDLGVVMMPQELLEPLGR